MGLGGPARQNTRRQLERNVYRIERHTMGWRRFYGAPCARPAGADGLFGETDRTGKRNGRVRNCLGRPTSTTLSGFDRLAHPAAKLIATAPVSAPVLYLT